RGGGRLRVLADIVDIRHVDRYPEDRHRRNRDLEQPAPRERPPERIDRSSRVAERAEQRLAALPLLGAELRGREKVRSRDGVQHVRKHARVVLVAALGEHLEQRGRHAEARAAEALRPHARGPLDALLGPLELLDELLPAVEVQPRLVVEAVAPDRVPGRREALERAAVLLERGVTADDENRRRETPLLEKLDDARDDRVE